MPPVERGPNQMRMRSESRYSLRELERIGDRDLRRLVEPLAERGLVEVPAAVGDARAATRRACRSSSTASARASSAWRPRISVSRNAVVPALSISSAARRIEMRACSAVKAPSRMKTRSAIQTHSGTSSPQPRRSACGRWRRPSTRPGVTTQPCRSRTGSSGPRADSWTRRGRDRGALDRDRGVAQDAPLGVHVTTVQLSSSISRRLDAGRSATRPRPSGGPPTGPPKPSARRARRGAAGRRPAGTVAGARSCRCGRSGTA